jgi:hypothetical protein
MQIHFKRLPEVKNIFFKKALLPFASSQLLGAFFYEISKESCEFDFE